MNWVLLAGLVRDPENALVQAAQIHRLMGAGLVQGSVFSTWHGEFERYPAVHQAFRDLGTILIESPQPHLRFPGHVLHQSLSLQIGLEHIPDGARVLRIRPDVAPISRMMDDVLAKDWLTTDHGFGRPTAYEHRLWCCAGLLDWPFYINDILFYGYKPDVERLCRIDLTMEWRYSETAAEQFYHLGPIAAVNPVLDLYARFQRGQHGPVENRKRSDVLWGCAFWYDALLATAGELLSNYCVGYADPDDVFSESEMQHFSTISLRSIFQSRTTTRYIQTHEGVGGNTFHALHWARAILERRFRADEYSDRLDAARGRSRDEIRANARAYGDRMRDAFGLPLPTMEADGWGIIRRPAKSINIQAQTTTDYTRQLEDEISHLRRLIDTRPQIG